MEKQELCHNSNYKPNAAWGKMQEMHKIYKIIKFCLINYKILSNIKEQVQTTYSESTCKMSVLL